MAFSPKRCIRNRVAVVNVEFSVFENVLWRALGLNARPVRAG